MYITCSKNKVLETLINTFKVAPYRKHLDMIHYSFVKRPGSKPITDKFYKHLNIVPEYLIVSETWQHIVIPKNDLITYTYDIPVNEGFEIALTQLLKYTPCVLCIMDLKKPILLYFQTQNEHKEWTYTIANLATKTIEHREFNALPLLHGQITQYTTSEVYARWGQPLHITKSKHTTVYIYSFFSDNKIYNETPAFLNEQYSSYYMLLSFNSDNTLVGTQIVLQPILNKKT